MSQIKFYKYGMLGLLILNISIISFFFITKPKHPNELPGDSNFMRSTLVDLELDEDQKEIFYQSSMRHNTMMRKISEDQKSLLKPYFLSISHSKDYINKDSIIIEIQKLEEKKVNETYVHFEEVKALLKPEQQKNFDEFLLHAIGRIMGGN